MLRHDYFPSFTSVVKVFDVYLEGITLIPSKLISTL